MKPYAMIERGPDFAGSNVTFAFSVVRVTEAERTPSSRSSVDYRVGFATEKMYVVFHDLKK